MINLYVYKFVNIDEVNRIVKEKQLFLNTMIKERIFQIEIHKKSTILWPNN